MAASTCVRVCLHFSDLDDETCWFLVDFKKMPSIECMQRAIGRKFYNKEETLFKLTLKGSLLPAWESSCILRDDDQIIVKPETATCPSSTYWSKKRKRRKKSLTDSKRSDAFSSTKSKSLDSTETKNPKSLLNKESILTPETSPDNIGTPDNINTPDAVIEDQKSYKKKKKKKLDCANDVPIEIEEAPAPKKTKISKSPKPERKFKKKAVIQQATPEVVEIKDPKKVISPKPDDHTKGKVTICDKSDTGRDLEENKPEVIKLDDDDVPANSNDTIPMEISDTLPPLSNSKDVSIEIKDNPSEDTASLVELTGGNEINLTNLESSTKSGTSDPEKTYCVQEDYSCSIEEKVEVYKIAKDDLDVICQSLKVGDSLTIDPDKVKVIDIENASNSSWLECVDVGNDKTKTHETAAAKENKKGSGNNLRRRRRRRGQRSFACSPFIFAMNQSLDSDADNISPVSTPVASKPKKPVSSNSSQKHFYFESDGEDDVEEEEENNISQPEMFVVEDSKNNFQCSKSTLSSDKNVIFKVTNGAEDSNSSLVSQEGEEKEDNGSSSSQKCPSKRSVHFALNDDFCESFDSSKGPIIYKRGQSPIQRRNYPTLIRQQQLNTSFESCSSICKGVEDDSDVKPVNGSTPTPKPTKEYSLLPGIVGYPRAGDKIAFKRLEIGEDYSPRLSDFIAFCQNTPTSFQHLKEAKVISFKEDVKMLEMKILSAPKSRKKDKFELIYKDDKDIMILEEPEQVPESVELCTLQEVKLLK